MLNSGSKKVFRCSGGLTGSEIGTVLGGSMKRSKCLECLRTVVGLKKFCERTCLFLKLSLVSIEEFYFQGQKSSCRLFYWLLDFVKVSLTQSKSTLSYSSTI